MQQEPMTYNFRYAHSAFQTLIRAGRLKVKIQAFESNSH